MWNYCYIHSPSPLPAYFYIVGLLCSVSKSVQLYAETVPGYIMATGYISSIKHSSPIMLCSESVAACWLSHQYLFIVTLWGSGSGAPADHKMQ